MSRFSYTNVPESGTKERDRDSRAHKGIGTLSRPVSRPVLTPKCPARVPLTPDELKAQRILRQHAACIQVPEVDLQWAVDVALAARGPAVTKLDPFALAASPRRTQADVQAHLTRLLLDGQGLTATQAAERLVCDPSHARRALSAMHDAHLLRIARWERHTTFGGPWVAVYVWTAGALVADAPYPRRNEEVCHG